MRKAAIRVALLAALVGCGTSADEPFRRLDLREDCKIYFLRTEALPSQFNERNGSFCLSDKGQIDRLMKSWKFTEEHDPMACGFEYTVYVLQNDTPITELSLNGACGYAVTDNGWYDFDTLLYAEIDEVHMQHLDTKTADSLNAALNALFGP